MLLPVVWEAAPAPLPAELGRDQARRLSRSALPSLRGAPIRVTGAVHHSVRAASSHRSL